MNNSFEISFIFCVTNELTLNGYKNYYLVKLCNYHKGLRQAINKKCASDQIFYIKDKFGCCITVTFAQPYIYMHYGK